MARELSLRGAATVTVLEKETGIAMHQTGHNSGVIHAGIYYKPGSLKALLCRAGSTKLIDYCRERGIPVRQNGKLVVAIDGAEEVRLREIADRARANKVPGIKLLDARGMREIEPHVEGVLALHSPSTAVVDFTQVARSFASDVTDSGGTIICRCKVKGIDVRGREAIVRTSMDKFAFDHLVICAGLFADRVSELAGGQRDPRIVPFRGEYFHLRDTGEKLVNSLVYPVPDPATPFLGVHFTRHVDGLVSVGPNAVLALAREGYQRRKLSGRDLASTLGWPGTRRMARHYWRYGAKELMSSMSRRYYLDRAKRYVPELELKDLSPRFAGIRAQAIDRRGNLVDDFVVARAERITEIRNAPSPAATSSIAIAAYICDEYLKDIAS